MKASAPNQRGNPHGEHLKQALADQPGLELAPGTAPVEFLLIEKAKQTEK